MDANAAEAPTPEELAILVDLQAMTYDEVRDKHGWSRGKIYALAMKHGARKTENKIRERAADRKRRQRETLEAILDQTATADVLDYLDGLPDGCARLIVTSPPYNLGKDYGSHSGADSVRHLYWCGWMMQIISEAARVLDEGGVLFLQVGSTRDETGTLVPIDVILFEALKKSGLTFQNRVAWTVGHGLTPKRRLAERYETALIFSKGDPAHFNVNAVRIPQKQPGKRAFKGPNAGKLSGNPLGAWPTNVWDVPNIGANNGEKTGHPAQMPSELVRRAVMLYSMPGELVLDFFSGSGTTHSVCIETGRRFSGCDLFYADLRAQRLASVGLAETCPLPGVTDESIAVWQAEAVRVDFDPAAQQLELLDAA